MPFLWNVVAKVWEYEKDWETKWKYLTVWALFSSDEYEWQYSIKLDAIPTDCKWLNVYPKKKKTEDQSWSEQNTEELPF